MKTIIIVGGFGQDGKILNKILLKKKIYNITRNKIFNNYKYIGRFNINNQSKIDLLVKKLKPECIYYFAAYHHASDELLNDSRKLLKKSFLVNTNGVINFLESIKRYSKKTKFFYASSRLIFGKPKKGIVTENSQYNPLCIYGLSKVTSMKLIEYYRKNFNLKIFVGIFFNHDSEFRAERFLVMKIIKKAIMISKGNKIKIFLSNISAKIDLGCAYDYMNAVVLLTKKNKNFGDYIFSTGRLVSIKKIINTIFEELKIDPKKYIFTKKNNDLRTNFDFVGDSSKLQKFIKWKPNLNFKILIKNIIEAKKK